jgi:hypothetical protein
MQMISAHNPTSSSIQGHKIALQGFWLKSVVSLRQDGVTKAESLVKARASFSSSSFGNAA